MSARVVFIVTVADEKNLEQKSETRRIPIDRAAQWNEKFSISALITDVKYGPDYPCLMMFTRLFALGSREVANTQGFDPIKWRSNPRLAWGLIKSMSSCGLVIINHNVIKVMEGHSKLPDKIEANKLYCLVFRKDAEPELLDTEGMAPNDFLALVEEAGARVPTGR